MNGGREGGRKGNGQGMESGGIEGFDLSTRYTNIPECFRQRPAPSTCRSYLAGLGEQTATLLLASCHLSFLPQAS